MLKVIGHRGMGPTHNLPQQERVDAPFPENSLIAFQQALAHGADGIEIDIALSKDHTPVVIHDQELWKHILPGNDATVGNTNDYTVTEIKSFSIGQDQTIPLLDEVISLFLTYAKSSSVINIDLKEKNTVVPVYESLRPHLSNGSLKHSQIVICSYDWDMLREFRNIDSHLQLTPCIKTTLLFGKDGVSMPGYIPIVDYYAQDSMKTLQDFHNEITCHSFDCVITDVRQPLITLASQNNIGLMLSTGNNRVDAQQTSYDDLLQIMQNKESPAFCIYKADEPITVKHTLDALLKQGKPVQPTP
jgi:glycerophosphoryl diester phosphodiesterase